MIKLKHLIQEAYLTEKSLDMSNKEDAAEYLIRQAWNFVPAGEDRYDPKDILLWIDNEMDLNNLALKLAEKFYPDEDEPLYVFQSDIETVLHKLELKRLETKKKKNPSLKDPLYILKKLMVGKNWEQVKRAIANNSLSNFEGNVGRRKIEDEGAEEVFERLYRNAMGETSYDLESLVNYGYGRLSTLSVKPDEGNTKQYSINMFLRHYNSGNPMSGIVQVWRGTNNPHADVRPGDYVTFDRGYAQGYMRGKHKSIVVGRLDSKDLILDKPDAGRTEMVYWPEGHQIQKYEGHIPTLKDFWSHYRFGI
jgi:hypothetical protein